MRSRRMIHAVTAAALAAGMTLAVPFAAQAASITSVSINISSEDDQFVVGSYSESDVVDVSIPNSSEEKYHVVDWNAPVAMGGDQSAGRYLNCATHFDFYSQDEMNIPISSSHDIEIVGTPTATYQDFSGDSVVTENLPADSYTINTTGNSKVTVSHVMNTDLAARTAIRLSSCGTASSCRDTSSCPSALPCAT